MTNRTTKMMPPSGAERSSCLIMTAPLVLSCNRKRSWREGSERSTEPRGLHPGEERADAQGDDRDGQQLKRMFVGRERPVAIDVLEVAVGEDDASLDTSDLPTAGTDAAAERALREAERENGNRAK